MGIPKHFKQRSTQFFMLQDLPVLWEMMQPRIMQVSTAVPRATSLSHRRREVFQEESLVGQHSFSSLAVLSPGPGFWVLLGSFILCFSLLQSSGISLGLVSLAPLSYIH